MHGGEKVRELDREGDVLGGLGDAGPPLSPEQQLGYQNNKCVSGQADGYFTFKTAGLFEDLGSDSTLAD